MLNYKSGADSLISHYPLSPMTPAIGSGPTSYFAPQHSSGAHHPTSTISANTVHSSAVSRSHQRDTSTNGAGTPATQQRNIVGVLLPNGGGPDPDSAPQESMFLCLQDLFQRIQNHSKKTQYFTPTAFVAKVKKENGKAGRILDDEKAKQRWLEDVRGLRT